MSFRLFRFAVLYALFGIGFGIYMAATQHFEAKAVHGHALLAGWLSMAVMGLIYRAVPAMEDSRLAGWHVWPHVVGLPAMLAGVLMIHQGQPITGEPVAGIGSTIMAVGFVAFAINLWRTTAR